MPLPPFPVHPTHPSGRDEVRGSISHSVCRGLDREAEDAESWLVPAESTDPTPRRDWLTSGCVSTQGGLRGFTEELP